VGSRTANPTIYATDSAGDTSPQVSFPAVTIQSTSVIQPPTVTVTAPTSTSTDAFTSKPVNLVLFLTDPNGTTGDVVTYTVNWGDGTTPTTGTTGSGNTLTGVSVPLTHAYPDSFASAPNTSPRTATLTITATNGGTAPVSPSQTYQFVVTYNTYPTATITSPQASGTPPTPAELPTGTASGFYNPATGTTPEMVVIPVGGQLTFNGTGTLPGSGDAGLNYNWTFQNGIPSSATSANAGQVTFVPNPSATNGYTLCLVTLTVTDAFSRVSSNGPAANVNTYEQWVVIDATNSQYFSLEFLYRQMGTDNTVVSLNPVQTAANGYGANVQIYQDGSTGSWPLLSGNIAQAIIPVRSNLPFSVAIPGFGTDTHGYSLQIPNAPTGPYADSTLVTASPLPANTAGFGFEFPSAIAAPWNPTLQVVTGQGFGPEGIAPTNQTLMGTVNGAGMVIGTTPSNTRWVDRLQTPLTDPDGAIQWEQDSTDVGEFNNILGYETFAEWPIVPETIDSATIDGNDANSKTAGKPADLGFNVNYATYANSTSQDSLTFMVLNMQTFRVPPDSNTPYNLSNIGGVGWGKATCTSFLNPTDLIYNPTPPNVPDYTIPNFYNQMVYGDAGVVPLQGGLQTIHIPYDPNDPTRTPKTTLNTRSFNGIRSIFSYSEYIWSSEWARPMVLNNSSLNYIDSGPQDPNFPANPYLGLYQFFRFSQPAAAVQPAAWPQFVSPVGIVPDNSQYNLNAVGGPSFDASSPVLVNQPTKVPSATAVGRFYWTAYTPSYDAGVGAVISRTWQALDNNNSANNFTNSTTNVTYNYLNDKPPTTFPAASKSGDAVAAFGFIPPQDTVVDKRGRNADGSLNGSATGGYRVTWFNPTLDANNSKIGPPFVPGNPVPPDFWVVELITTASNSSNVGTSVHFMLPSNFPAIQTATATVLTDARTYLPSGNTFAQGPATTSGVVTDAVSPGTCWFDVPLELRPLTGTEATITVFAMKAILKNNPVNSAFATAHAINRLDWIDAIKTATAQVSVVPSSGLDISYAHKIPFRYPWDVVVANGPAIVAAQ
jgi:hypothetical protein